MPEHEMGPMAKHFADSLVTKNVEFITGFPASTPEEQAAVAETVASALLEKANELRASVEA